MLLTQRWNSGEIVSGQHLCHIIKTKRHRQLMPPITGEGHEKRAAGASCRARGETTKCLS